MQNPLEYGCCGISHTFRILRNYRIFIVLASLSFLSFPIHSTPISIQQGTEKISLTGKAFYYKDRSGKLSFAEILQINNTGRGFLDVVIKPNFGYILDAVWLKVPVFQPSGDNRWVIEFYYPLHDSISMFYVNPEGKSVEVKSGDQLQFSDRPILRKNFVFYVPDNNGKPIDLYFKIQSESSLNTEATLWVYEAYENHAIAEYFIFGLYFGIVLIMALYNIFLYISIRDKTYLFYIGYILSFGLFQLNLTGIGFQFLWPDFPVIGIYSLNFSAGFSMIFSVLFSVKFLDMKTHLPFIYKICMYFILPISALQVMSPLLLDYSFGVRVGTANALFFPVVSTYAGVFCLIKGYRPARFFLLAWTFFSITVFIWSAASLGMISISFFSRYGMQAGQSIEVLLLSLALGDRLSLLTTEKNEAQNNLLRSRINLLKSFSRFVPTEFLDHLGKKSVDLVSLGDSVQKEMTILFADIRSFTTLSESMTPNENFRFLNAIFRRIGPIIRHNKGFIDKYLGDGIMALFPESPDSALNASIQICRLLREYNLIRETRGQLPIRVGIGIHTGNLMLGTIGESERMEGTVISDAVNLASRVEGLTKYYSAITLITEETKERLEKPLEYSFRKLDPVMVKGKNRKVTVYEFLDCEPDDIKKLKISYSAGFQEAVDLYHSGNITVAMEKFKNIIQLSPNDNAIKTYLHRCTRLIDEGIPDDWNPTLEYREK